MTATTFQIKHPGELAPWSKCSARECGASILWVETVNGRRMPLDRLESGLFDWHEAGEIVTVGSEDTHWATCPARAQFTKGRT